MIRQITGAEPLREPMSDQPLAATVLPRVNRHIEQPINPELGTESKAQNKYYLDSPGTALELLYSTPGVEFKQRTHQTDYYIINGDETPNFETEYVRIREENTQEPAGSGAPSGYICSVTYKSKAKRLDDKSLVRNQQTVRITDDEGYSLLDEFADRRVRQVVKERTTFNYRGAVINIDQGVAFSDAGQEPTKPLGAGCFIEIEHEVSDSETTQNILNLLGLAQATNISAPYANSEYFISRFNDRYKQHMVNKLELLEELSIKNGDYVEYDSKSGMLNKGVDWKHFLEDDTDTGFAKLAERDEGIQSSLINSINKKLGTVLNFIEEHSPGGDIVQAFSGNLTGYSPVSGIKTLKGVDGFKNYKLPTELLSSRITLEIRGLSNQHTSFDDGTRMFLTLGRLKTYDTNTAPVVVFLHKIFRTKSDKYSAPTNQWIERHKVR